MVQAPNATSGFMLAGLLSGVCWLAGMARAALPAPLFSPVAPGVEYARQVVPAKPWSIHLVKVAWPSPAYELTTTLGGLDRFGLAPVARQAQAVTAVRGIPLMAINGDLFTYDAGSARPIPNGLHISQGELMGDPAGVPAFWIHASGRSALAQVQSYLKVRGPSGWEMPFTLNKPRTATNAVLYTFRFGSSTRTTNGWDIILAPESPASPLLQANQTLKTRVRAINRQGNSSLGPRLLVLSVGPNLLLTMPKIEVGQTLSLDLDVYPALDGVKTALGGEPILIDKGRLSRWTHSQFPQPRTALGWNDQFIYFLVVDGRQPTLSIGMTLPEITDYFHRLGCTHALNLDGGGSTTLWIKGKVVNSPSDHHERPVINALVLMQLPPARDSMKK